MAPTPPSLTTASSSASAQSPDAEFRVVRKRNRVPLSCGACRHRKLKCNRAHPCENCVKRGEGASCTFATPGSRKKSQIQVPATPDDMQNRIDRLEGLILSMMTNGAQSAGPTAAQAVINRSLSDTTSPPAHMSHDVDDVIIRDGDEEADSDLEEVADSLGMLKVDLDKEKSMYIGDSHWHNVLKDVQEVKSFFAVHRKEFEKGYARVTDQSRAQYALDGTILLLGPHEPATDLEIRAELPPKSTVDKLVAKFLSGDDPCISVLHGPTIQQQLAKHWQDPSKTSMQWLAMLYAILSLSMRVYERAGGAPPEFQGREAALSNEYRLRTVQCLVNSDYTKPTHCTIHALVLYANTEFGSRFDIDVAMWTLLGMIMRLAMRMGYHRNPDNFQGLTPFAGEMQRRVWAQIRHFDVLLSFNLGLPIIIKDSECDVDLPRNILDHELGPEIKSLPPSRPLTEATPVTHLIARCRIVFEFSRILEMQGDLRAKHITYDQIMKHDNTLREAKALIPPQLRIKPLDQYTDQNDMGKIMYSYGLELMWLKSLCVLHRKHLVRARSNPRYTHSRRTCVDASMTILRYHRLMTRETQPGGQLSQLKRHFQTCTQADYLLAAMIICLDLHYDTIAESAGRLPPNHDPYFFAPEQRAEMLSAIEDSHAIWQDAADTSIEAFKASSILGVVLEALRRNKAKKGADVSAVAPPVQQYAPLVASDKAEESAAMTLGMLSGGVPMNSMTGFSPPSDAQFSGVSGGLSSNNISPEMAVSMTPFGTMPFSLFNDPNSDSMMDTSNPAMLDWDAWDEYVQNGANMDTNFDYFPTSIEQVSPRGDGRPTFDAGMYSTGGGNGVFMGASLNK